MNLTGTLDILDKFWILVICDSFIGLIPDISELLFLYTLLIATLLYTVFPVFGRFDICFLLLESGYELWGLDCGLVFWLSFLLSLLLIFLLICVFSFWLVTLFNTLGLDLGLLIFLLWLLLSNFFIFWIYNFSIFFFSSSFA